MTLDWIAVVAAGLSAFVLGGLWYSPLLFAKGWQREAGVSDEALKNANPAIIFGGAAVLSVIAAAMFAYFLGPKPPLDVALFAGATAGLCWVGTSFAINYLFERRSVKLFLINGGYHTLQFVLYGLVLSLLG